MDRDLPAATDRCRHVSYGKPVCKKHDIAVSDQRFRDWSLEHRTTQPLCHAAPLRVGIVRSDQLDFLRDAQSFQKIQTNGTEAADGNSPRV